MLPVEQPQLHLVLFSLGIFLSLTNIFGHLTAIDQN